MNQLASLPELPKDWPAEALTVITLAYFKIGDVISTDVARDTWLDRIAKSLGFAPRFETRRYKVLAADHNIWPPRYAVMELGDLEH